MRISTKGRYGLAVMVVLGQAENGVTAGDAAKTLGLSKIYLEQVFTLLKKGGLIQSTIGKGGGYRLISTPKEVTALDILKATEVALFEETEKTVSTDQILENTLGDVWGVLDSSVVTALSGVTLQDLIDKSKVSGEYSYDI
ncbi:MAG: Rrf2 family transcriptional regulator [Firmicutes bacterium]|nr:Rrf2 family transcriptional regulator [Bacillota bacterium]